MTADIHVHLLPGVDDGPADVEESLALALLLVADGTQTAVATPHVADVDPLTVPARAADLQTELDRESIPLRLLPGGELAARLVEELADRDLDAVAVGPPGSRWLLVEAPLTYADPADFERHVRVAWQRGFGVVIAHPERSPALRSARATLLGLARDGARLQVSAPSLLSRHGEEALRFGAELLAAGHATLLASDAHSPDRPPCLRAALAARPGDEQAVRAARLNPAAAVQAGVATASGGPSAAGLGAVPSNRA